MSTTLRLNCLIEGESIVFLVNATREDAVSDLKKLIQSERVLGTLKGVDPHDLELWKPKDSNPIPAEPEVTLVERIRSLGHGFSTFADKLGSSRAVFDIFSAQPSRDCIHIIVKVPSTDIRQDKRKHDEDSDLPLKRLRLDIGVAPSTLANASRFKQIVGPGRAIALNRPLEPFTIPLVLLHETFAIFKDRCEEAPSERALICLGELAPVACEWHDLELERRTEIRFIFERRTGLRLYEQKIPGTEFITDGNLPVIIMPAAIRECKKEHGDVLNQAILYYANFLSKVHGDPRHFYNFNTCFPSILMIDMGSYLGYYGAIWDGKRVRVEPLTPIFDLSTHSKETKARWKIAAALDALMVAANSIEAHYKSIEAKAMVNPTPPEAYNLDLQKARSYPFLTSYKDNGQEINFMYNARLDDEKLVFSATVVNQPDSEEFIVKFTPWYSEDAHNCLASHDLAPRLRQCVRISADWVAVIMDKSNYRVPFDLRLSDKDCEKIQRKVMSAVQILHQEGFVHGDIRQANILVDGESLSDDLKIHLIDFDWAGPIGETVYPADVNKISVRRPSSVEGGGLITTQHDIEMVSFMFM